MSATRLSALLPLGGILRSPRTRHLGHLGLRLGLAPRCNPTRIAYGEPLLMIRLQQRRHLSYSGDKQSNGQRPPPPPPPPPPTWSASLAAVRRSLNFGPIFNAFRGNNLRRLFKQSPEELVLALVLLAGISVIVLYVIYSYFNYFQSEQFTRFPPEIAKSLRRALYYSNYSLDPKLAIKYYKLALEQCEQRGIDPFTDEVLGIKIQLAAWLEKIGSYANAIQVLEAILRDCQRWVAKMEESDRAGLIDKSGNLKSHPVVAKGPQVDEWKVEETLPENLRGKRTRILGRSVGISVKLGELYADEHVLQSDTAGERLIWAVETVLKELQRRTTEGVKEGEGDWMSPEQIGGALEALGNHYESKSKHYLAAPLFLQAITLSPPKSCHTAVLMNNLAISLAQQPVAKDAASTALGAHSPATRTSLLANARAWALQAHATGSSVTGEDKTPECDEACAVALCNLGEIAAMSGDMVEAKRRFKDSLALSKRIAFNEGVSQAQDGLDAASSMPERSS